MMRAIDAARPSRRLVSALLAGLAGAVHPALAQQAPAPEQGQTGQPRELEARPALRIRGQSTWDEGFDRLKAAFAALSGDARRLGLAAQGNPLAHFVDSDDLGFSYEAYLPLAMSAPADLAFAAGIDAAPTPAGRAMMFPHEGAYDDIDTAYEAITAWLDEKGLQATGRFVEEYLVMPEKSDDPSLKLNIFVFLR